MQPLQDDLYYRFLVPLEDISIFPVPSEQVRALWGSLKGALPEARQLLSAELIAGFGPGRRPSTCLLVSYLDPYGRSALRLIESSRFEAPPSLAFQPQLAWDPAG